MNFFWMDDQEDKPMVFLVEGNLIEWEKPLKPGYTRKLESYNAQTELINPLGMDFVDESVGGYKIIASVAKYLADVIRLNRGKNGMIFRGYHDEVTGKRERLVLFDGGVQIYSEGIIPGTNLNGCAFESEGRIWLARGPVEDYSNCGGLRRALLGDDPSVYERNVEAILRGIDHVDAKQESRRFQREHQQWMAGLRQGESGRPLPDFLR